MILIFLMLLFVIGLLRPAVAVCLVLLLRGTLPPDMADIELPGIGFVHLTEPVLLAVAMGLITRGQGMIDPRFRPYWAVAIWTAMGVRPGATAHPPPGVWLARLSVSA